MVVYWVAYVRGSFCVKERYASAGLARSRCNDLVGEAGLIRIVPIEEHVYPLLSNCIELPPVVVPTSRSGASVINFPR
jgi:hypothetical protein